MTETADGKYNFRQKTRPDPIFIAIVFILNNVILEVEKIDKTRFN